MYYEEKIIDGVLCWRGGPDDKFTPRTAKELTDELTDLRSCLESYKSKMEQVVEILGNR